MRLSDSVGPPACPPSEPECDVECGEGEICLYMNEGLGCFRTCQTDSDCSVSEVCLCPGGQRAQCVPASCRAEEDCAEGEWCALSQNSCGIGGALACRGPQDACSSDTDCEEHEVCELWAGTWTCGNIVECM